MIEAAAPSELEGLVNDKMDNGWLPLGGVFVVEYGYPSRRSEWVFYQAMVRYEQHDL